MRKGHVVAVLRRLSNAGHSCSFELVQVVATTSDHRRQCSNAITAHRDKCAACVPTMDSLPQTLSPSFLAWTC